MMVNCLLTESVLLTSIEVNKIASDGHRNLINWVVLERLGYTVIRTKLDKIIGEHDILIHMFLKRKHVAILEVLLTWFTEPVRLLVSSDVTRAIKPKSACSMD